MVSPLISTEELARQLEGDRAPVVLDVRWTLAGPPGVDAYRRAHIAGAQFVDLDRELAAPPGRGRHPLPDAEEFAAAMRAHGISSHTPVVVYDAGPGTSAARAWWLLRYFGHAGVRVLDGGFAAWAAEHRPLTTEMTSPRPGAFSAHAGHLPLLDAAGAADVAAQGVLLDARASERFCGDVEPVDPVAGHIPGARSLPATGNVDEAGRMLDAVALRERFAAAGVTEQAAVGAYCGSGVVAAQEVLALHVAGFVEAALYAGSWSDWITDPHRPVATGGGEPR